MSKGGYAFASRIPYNLDLLSYYQGGTIIYFKGQDVLIDLNVYTLTGPSVNEVIQIVPDGYSRFTYDMAGRLSGAYTLSVSYNYNGISRGPKTLNFNYKGKDKAIVSTTPTVTIITQPSTTNQIPFTNFTITTNVALNKITINYTLSTSTYIAYIADDSYKYLTYTSLHNVFTIINEIGNQDEIRSNEELYEVDNFYFDGIYPTSITGTYTINFLKYEPGFINESTNSYKIKVESSYNGWTAARSFYNETKINTYNLTYAAPSMTLSLTRQEYRTIYWTNSQTGAAYYIDDYFIGSNITSYTVPYAYGQTTYILKATKAGYKPNQKSFILDLSLKLEFLTQIGGSVYFNYEGPTDSTFRIAKSSTPTSTTVISSRAFVDMTQYTQVNGQFILTASMNSDPSKTASITFSYTIPYLNMTPVIQVGNQIKWTTDDDYQAKYSLIDPSQTSTLITNSVVNTNASTYQYSMGDYAAGNYALLLERTGYNNTSRSFYYDTPYFFLRDFRQQGINLSWKAQNDADATYTITDPLSANYTITSYIGRPSHRTFTLSSYTTNALSFGSYSINVYDSTHSVESLYFDYTPPSLETPTQNGYTIRWRDMTATNTSYYLSGSNGRIDITANVSGNPRTYAMGTLPSGQYQVILNVPNYSEVYKTVPYTVPVVVNTAVRWGNLLTMVGTGLTHALFTLGSSSYNPPSSTSIVTMIYFDNGYEGKQNFDMIQLKDGYGTATFTGGFFPVLGIWTFKVEADTTATVTLGGSQVLSVTEGISTYTYTVTNTTAVPIQIVWTGDQNKNKLTFSLIPPNGVETNDLSTYFKTTTTSSIVGLTYTSTSTNQNVQDYWTRQKIFYTGTATAVNGTTITNVSYAYKSDTALTLFGLNLTGYTISGLSTLSALSINPTFSGYNSGYITLNKNTDTNIITLRPITVTRSHSTSKDPTTCTVRYGPTNKIPKSYGTVTSLPAASTTKECFVFFGYFKAPYTGVHTFTISDGLDGDYVIEFNIISIETDSNFYNCRTIYGSYINPGDSNNTDNDCIASLNEGVYYSVRITYANLGTGPQIYCNVTYNSITEPIINYCSTEKTDGTNGLYYYALDYYILYNITQTDPLVTGYSYTFKKKASLILSKLSDINYAYGSWEEQTYWLNKTDSSIGLFISGSNTPFSAIELEISNVELLQNTIRITGKGLHGEIKLYINGNIQSATYTGTSLEFDDTALPSGSSFLFILKDGLVVSNTYKYERKSVYSNLPTLTVVSMDDVLTFSGFNLLTTTVSDYPPGWTPSVFTDKITLTIPYGSVNSTVKFTPIFTDSTSGVLSYGMEVSYISSTYVSNGVPSLTSGGDSLTYSGVNLTGVTMTNLKAGWSQQTTPTSIVVTIPCATQKTTYTWDPIFKNGTKTLTYGLSNSFISPTWVNDVAPTLDTTSSGDTLTYRGSNLNLITISTPTGWTSALVSGNWVVTIPFGSVRSSNPYKPVFTHDSHTVPYTTPANFTSPNWVLDSQPSRVGETLTYTGSNLSDVTIENLSDLGATLVASAGNIVVTVPFGTIRYTVSFLPVFKKGTQSLEYTSSYDYLSACYLDLNTSQTTDATGHKLLFTGKALTGTEVTGFGSFVVEVLDTTITITLPLTTPTTTFTPTFTKGVNIPFGKDVTFKWAATGAYVANEILTLPGKGGFIMNNITYDSPDKWGTIQSFQNFTISSVTANPNINTALGATVSGVLSAASFFGYMVPTTPTNRFYSGGTDDVLGFYIGSKGQTIASFREEVNALSVDESLTRGAHAISKGFVLCVGLYTYTLDKTLEVGEYYPIILNWINRGGPGWFSFQINGTSDLSNYVKTSNRADRENKLRYYVLYEGNNNYLFNSTRDTVYSFKRIHYVSDPKWLIYDKLDKMSVHYSSTQRTIVSGGNVTGAIVDISILSANKSGNTVTLLGTGFRDGLEIYLGGLIPTYQWKGGVISFTYTGTATSVYVMYGYSVTNSVTLTYMNLTKSNAVASFPDIATVRNAPSGKIPSIFGGSIRFLLGQNSNTAFCYFGYLQPTFSGIHEFSISVDGILDVRIGNKTLYDLRNKGPTLMNLSTYVGDTNGRVNGSAVLTQRTLYPIVMTYVNWGDSQNAVCNISFNGVQTSIFDYCKINYINQGIYYYLLDSTIIQTVIPYNSSSLLYNPIAASNVDKIFTPDWGYGTLAEQTFWTDTTTISLLGNTFYLTPLDLSKVTITNQLIVEGTGLHSNVTVFVDDKSENYTYDGNINVNLTNYKTLYIADGLAKSNVIENTYITSYTLEDTDTFLFRGEGLKGTKVTYKQGGVESALPASWTVESESNYVSIYPPFGSVRDSITFSFVFKKTNVIPYPNTITFTSRSYVNTAIPVPFVTYLGETLTFTGYNLSTVIANVKGYPSKITSSDVVVTIPLGSVGTSTSLNPTFLIGGVSLDYPSTVPYQSSFFLEETIPNVSWTPNGDVLVFTGRNLSSTEVTGIRGWSYTTEETKITVNIPQGTVRNNIDLFPNFSKVGLLDYSSKIPVQSTVYLDQNAPTRRIDSTGEIFTFSGYNLSNTVLTNFSNWYYTANTSDISVSVPLGTVRKGLLLTPTFSNGGTLDYGLQIQTESSVYLDKVVPTTQVTSLGEKIIFTGKNLTSDMTIVLPYPYEVFPTRIVATVPLGSVRSPNTFIPTFTKVGLLDYGLPVTYSSNTYVNLSATQDISSNGFIFMYSGVNLSDTSVTFLSKGNLLPWSFFSTETKIIATIPFYTDITTFTPSFTKVGTLDYGKENTFIPLITSVTRCNNQLTVQGYGFNQNTSFLLDGTYTLSNRV